MLRKIILKYTSGDFWKESGSGGKKGTSLFIRSISFREFRFTFIFVDSTLSIM